MAFTPSLSDSLSTSFLVILSFFSPPLLSRTHANQFKQVSVFFSPSLAFERSRQTQGPSLKRSLACVMFSHLFFKLICNVACFSSARLHHISALISFISSVRLSIQLSIMPGSLCPSGLRVISEQKWCINSPTNLDMFLH